MYDRIYGLFSDIQINRLNNANILLVGVGGVGSFCFETLIRSGIKNITIIDHDKYELSNLNRQLHSNLSNVGRYKVDVLKEYAMNINSEIKVNAINEYINFNSNLNLNEYDFIIDACDSIEAKIYLIMQADKLNIKIISSLGVGNRINPACVRINTLRKTINDPLGKKLRHELNKNNFFKDVPVVSSSELPIKQKKISSCMAVTSVAGVYLASYVVEELIKNEN